MTRARALLLPLLLAACSHGSRVEPGEPTAPGTREAADAGTPPGALTPGVATPSTPSQPDQSAITPAQAPPNVKIMVRTNPPKVWVYWGKKKLGLTPLNFERPRDSGPVDLVLRAQGYFPVHTRAYTVKNDLVGVKMIKVEDRMTIYGAKAELPPEGPLDPLDPANAKLPPPGTPTPAPPPSTPTPAPPTP